MQQGVDFLTRGGDKHVSWLKGIVESLKRLAAMEGAESSEDESDKSSVSEALSIEDAVKELGDQNELRGKQFFSGPVHRCCRHDYRQATNSLVQAGLQAYWWP